MNKTKKWFTVIELVVAITISATILIFVMSFIASTFSEISYSNKKTQLLVNLYDFENKIKNIREKYLSWTILIDNNSWTWSDIILIRTQAWETNESWYLIAQIEKDTLKIDPNSNIDNINEKYLALRKVNSLELNELIWNPSKVYDYNFNLDEIFEKVLLKDLQAVEYNSWTILEIEMDINLNYNPKLKWSSFKGLWSIYVEKIIFDL